MLFFQSNNIWQLKQFKVFQFSLLNIEWVGFFGWTEEDPIVLAAAVTEWKGKIVFG